MYDDRECSQNRILGWLSRHVRRWRWLRESEEWEINVGGSLRLLIRVSNQKRTILASPSPHLRVAKDAEDGVGSAS